MRLAHPLLTLSLALGVAAAAGCQAKDDVPADLEAALDAEKNPDAAPAPADGKPNDKTGIVGRKTIEVLDAPAVIAAGTHTIAQDKIGEGSPLGGADLGGGPISAPLNALGGATGSLGRVGMQQWVDLQYATTGEYPTYEQLTAYLQKNKQYAMPMPRLSQRYGYDENRGAMVLLNVVGGIPKEGGSLDMKGDRLLPNEARGN